jgi:ATP-binding cassette subfamily F protein 3
MGRIATFLNHVVDLLVVLDGEGKAQVIHGNYDTYERMRALKEEEVQQEQRKTQARKAAESKAAAATPQKRRRKFPYRKVEDLEADIALAESELQELEEQMASPDLYREGERVKEVTTAFEETKARLQRLYEHWEEAVELN